MAIKRYQVQFQRQGKGDIAKKQVGVGQWELVDGNLLNTNIKCGNSC